MQSYFVNSSKPIPITMIVILPATQNTERFQMTVKILHEYTNMDNDKIKECLEFSLTRTELAENLYLKEEFEEIDRISHEPKREMTTEEVRKMFLLIKELMRLTYGVRGEKGGRIVHIKTPEVWESFVEAGVYDSFIWWLFEDKKRANDFMVNLMPASLRDEAVKIQAAQRERGAPIESYEVPIAPEPEPELSGGQKPKRQEPTHEELLQMFREKEINRRLDPNTED